MSQAATVDEFIIPEETRRRIESAERLLVALQTINEVYDDLPFWKSRIRRGVTRYKKNLRKRRYAQKYVTNAWSFRGNVSIEYLEALSNCLKQISPQFQVGRTHPEDPLVIFEPKVIVFW